MIYFGALLLWIIAAMSFVSVAVASDRIKTSVSWLSGFITCTAVFDTLAVFFL